MLVIAAPPARPSPPIVQGNAVVHEPLFETKIRPAGVGSSTMTPVAADGPMLSSEVLNVMV